MSETNESEFNKKSAYLKSRFPDAKFAICCFDNLEEIETKVLCDDEMILYEDSWDEYIPRFVKNKLYKDDYTIFKDLYLVKRKEGENHIYYKDVIDTLIEKGLKRDCDHRYMENIRLTNEKRTNENCLNTYVSFWGS